MHRIYWVLIYLSLTSFCFASVKPQLGIHFLPQKKSHAFEFSGYIDTSYNDLERRNVFTSHVDDRVYDIEPNGFTLQQAAITLAKRPPQGFGGLLNIVGGRDANKLAANGWNPYFGSQTLAIDIPQLYAQYATNAFVIMGGKFATLAGNETYNPTQDSNFSRSILDGYGEPSTHVGLRGTYHFNKKFAVIAGINNGWDSIKNINQQKTIELGIDYTPSSLLYVALVGYSGEEPLVNKSATGPKAWRTLVNLIAQLNATDKLSLVMDVDYGVQNKAALPNDVKGRAIWQGIAGYINYKFNEKWKTSFRGEVFDDQDGYRTGVRQNWRELTLTLAYLPIKNIELRAETRHDFSNVHSFIYSNNRNRLSDKQQSFALEGLYLF